jgi:hypothetical protein
MATVYVSIGHAGAISLQGNMPVFAGLVRAETITSSGTAASGLLEGQTGNIAQIACATAVIASVRGAASATNGLYVPAGVPAYLAMAAGDTISVIDA